MPKARLPAPPSGATSPPFFQTALSEGADVVVMNIIELDTETLLERRVRYGLAPESGILEGMRRIAEQTRREKRRAY